MKNNVTAVKASHGSAYSGHRLRYNLAISIVKAAARPCVATSGTIFATAPPLSAVTVPGSTSHRPTTACK